MLGGEVLGVVDEEFGFFFGEGQEVFALDAEGMIDEAIEVGLVGEGQMSLEDHSIMAAEDGDNGRGELDDERGSSLAWRSAPEGCLSNTILTAERLLCFDLFGCGDSRVRGGGWRRRHPLTRPEAGKSMSFHTCWEVRPTGGQPAMPLADLLARLADAFPVHKFDPEGALARRAPPVGRVAVHID